MKFLLEERTLPPIEVEIKGVTYAVRPVTKKIWKTLRQIQDQVTGGETGAIFDQIPVLLDLPAEVEEGLEFREVMLIVKHITTQMYAPFGGLSGEEKNDSKPGSLPSQ
jgi:hypothetical protein